MRHPRAEIGPNAVLQTLRALEEQAGAEAVRAACARAELPDPAPARMIPEAWFVRLVASVRHLLPAEQSDAVLARAGALTAEYVRANRIPSLVRGLLAALPASAGMPLLVRAFEKHAWTFAGSGRFQASLGPPITLTLEGCPTCRAEAGAASSRRAGAYYEAAFEGLLHTADVRVRVREVACRVTGSPDCRFLVTRTDATNPT